ncbi:SDR family oxidoreductase [Candidatus Methylospira mobilis]|uniref:SDR family oxidoreductase n=2 Tax=Candidatus Methylospira mobilis TaxID=1808979 RepID=A0A5Q0BS31_9GAMM|nr:SDR family oxidoreductase [Candidatus Methylospira mobilis]
MVRSMIVLTGASGGVGSAILPSLAALDSIVAIYNNNAPVIDGLPNVIPYRLDLTSEEDVNAFVKSMETRLTNITLIHGAALARQEKLAVQFKTGDWDQVMEVNLRGNFLLTRALLMPMIKEKWGRIIHFSSAAGMNVAPGTLAYSTSKTALLGMSRVLGVEYARFGITSNILVNGYFDTGMYRALSEKIQKKLIDSIPSGKLGDPINITNAVEFLIKSPFVNCSAINIDGGV